MKVGTMWPPFIWLFIATKAVSGVEYHVRLFTSDIPNAGTDAEIAIQIQGKVWSSGSRTVKLRFPSDTRNTVATGSGNVENVPYPPAWTRIYLNFASGQNKWHANRIAVRKSGTSEWIIFKVNAWVGAPYVDERWRQPSHYEPYVAGVTWEIRVFTSDVEGAGTQEHATLQIAGDTKHTRDLVTRSGMSRNSMAKFYFDTVDVDNPEAISVSIPCPGSWHGLKISIKRIDQDEWINFPVTRWLGHDNPTEITIPTTSATKDSKTPCMNKCKNVAVEPVCGSDGNTYANLCMLQWWACRRQADVVFKENDWCVCEPNPCQNGGICEKLPSGDFTCTCVNGFRGETCGCKFDGRADIHVLICANEIESQYVFVEGSGWIPNDKRLKLEQEHHNARLEFIKRFVQDQDISADGIQIGVSIFYSSIMGAWNNFWMNEYHSKNDLLKLTSQWTTSKFRFPFSPFHRAGINERLQYAWEEAFTKEHGDRDGVPNVLVVVTNTRHDQKQEFYNQTDKLREHDIKVVVVNVSSHLDHNDLFYLANNNPSSVYNVDTFEELKNIKIQLQAAICPDCPGGYDEEGHCIFEEPKKAASDASTLQCQAFLTSALLGLIVAFM